MTSPKQQLEFPNRNLPARQAEADSRALRVSLSKRHASSPSNKFQLETEFAVVPGVTVIVGHSGAGKTTILRCIAGLCDPEEGRIAVGDRTLFDSQQRINLGSAKRRVGFVFQDLALFPHLSVKDNVCYGLRRLETAERQRRMCEVMEAFQIEHLSSRFPRQISGGEQQRVALARSLVTEPAVLLLDEPLSSLDPRTKASIIEDLRRWDDVRRIPILYVTHDYEEVFALGDRVIALDQGQIVAEGLPQEVIPTLRRELMARPSDFDNIFDATVVDVQEETMTCRITGTSILLETSPARVSIGAELRIGIRADEILLAASEPALVGTCNVIRGRVNRVERRGSAIEARVSCGGEFLVRLSSRSAESLGSRVSRDVWMMIRSQACHVVRSEMPRSLRRLFVFVCSGNTSRSPMAQAICNAEIAARLGVPLESLDKFGIKAMSAGLSARPGEPLTVEAEQTLGTIGMSRVEHRSSNLTNRLAEKAEVIFCMTEEQRQKLVAMFPQAAAKVHCLQPLGDIDDPTGKGSAAFLELADLLQQLIGERLNALGVTEAA